MADSVNDFFANVAADLPSLDNNYCDALVDDFCDNFIIEPIEVALKLDNIAVHKSPGPDQIPNWLLKEMGPFISNPLCAIFNASIRQGRVPTIWKKANVVPLPKCHPPRSIQNDLRPISLTPTLAKILESFVGRWILENIETQLDKNQFGALKGKSTSHALVSIIHKWCGALDAKKSVRALFVDFSKAFDRVDHTILLNKLQSYGAPHVLIKWIFSFLKDREQRVKIGQVYSGWRRLNAGFPQGTWMGPLAFVTLIDDLQPSCSVHKFIDDTTFTEILPSSSNSSKMDQYGEELERWSADNHMLINYSKTKEMILGNIDHRNLAVLSIGGHDIQQVTNFKLLGVNISDDLRWEAHIKAICSKVNSRLYFLKQLRRAGLSKADLRCFYVTVVRPVLEYACVVWHHGLTKAQSDKLEALQKRAIRIMFGCQAFDLSYDDLLSLSKLDALSVRRFNLNKSFFAKILNPTSCLHELLPPRRNTAITSKLRHALQFEPPLIHTTRYTSFVDYALANYQN